MGTELSEPTVGLNAMTPEEYTNWWVETLANDVKRLQSMTGIDQAKALRGKIAGDITGDLIGHLHGASSIATVGTERLSGKDWHQISRGLQIVWVGCQKTLEKFGQLLPEQYHGALQGILDEYQTLVENPKALDPQRMAGRVQDFHADLWALHREPEKYGMEKDDERYAHNLLYPREEHPLEA